MSNFLSIVLGCLASASGVSSSYGTTTTVDTSGLSTTDTSSETASFSAIMSKINSNIDTAAARTNTNSYGYGNYNYYNINSLNNSNTNTATTMITPNISAIANQIKKNKSGILSTDQQIRDYLLENYGGSVAEVIKNLSGVQNLSSQALSMQEVIFDQIVTKISIQVRDNIYKDYNSSNISYFSDDVSGDTETE